MLLAVLGTGEAVCAIGTGRQAAVCFRENPADPSRMDEQDSRRARLHPVMVEFRRTRPAFGVDPGLQVLACRRARVQLQRLRARAAGSYGNTGPLNLYIGSDRPCFRLAFVILSILMRCRGERSLDVRWGGASDWARQL